MILFVPIKGAALNFILPQTEQEEQQQEKIFSVPVSDLPYETLYQLAKNLEQLKKDKTKTLVVTCSHSKDGVDIQSKCPLVLIGTVSHSSPLD